MPGIPLSRTTRFRPLPRTWTLPPRDISTQRTRAWSPRARRPARALRFCGSGGPARPSPAAGPSRRPEQPVSQPPPQPRPLGPPPVARQALAAAGDRPKPPAHVTIIAVLSAAAAVMFLVFLAQTAAIGINPHGPGNLNQILVQPRAKAAGPPGRPS